MNNLAKELGCNKLALGHHRDDALETFFLSLIYEGRMSTFSPLTLMDRSGIVQIRPLILCEEKRIIHVARKENMPISKPQCPAAGKTQREDMKKLIKTIKGIQPDADNQMLHALLSTQHYNLWDKIKRS